MQRTTWEPLDPRQAGLAEARLVLHHAIQPVAAVGQRHAARAPDDGQQALTLGAGGLWLGAPVAGGGLRAGLDPVALELFLCDGEGAALASLPLAGRTVAEGLAFLAGELERRGQEGRLSLPQHPDDFPRHPLGAGARFEAGGEAPRAVLARLFANTGALLTALGAPDAAPRLWPHHFDLALTLHGAGLTFALGLSPGDGPTGRPYWYATPSPRPAPEALPVLAGGGRWRAEGWFGAELPLDALAPEGGGQRGQVISFLCSALSLVLAPKAPDLHAP